MRKFEIVNTLAEARGATAYLEIATPTAGFTFAMTDTGRFTVRHRLMYRCPDSFDDGQPITFRTAGAGSQELVREILDAPGQQHRYDVIFIDAWHGHAQSQADLWGALCLLAPGGLVVVHDCNPTVAHIATPEPQGPEWCGVTYQAFIDFVLSAEPAAWFTVDSDFGCGVVVGPGGRPFDGLPAARPPARILLDWVAAGADENTRFATFARHRQALLNLVSVAEFGAALGLQAATLPVMAPPAALLAAGTPPGGAGWVDGLVTVADGTRVLVGWAWDSAGAAPFSYASLLLDGRVVATAPVCTPRPDAAAHVHAPSENLGFHLAVPASLAAVDPERMAVIAWSCERIGTLSWGAGLS